MCALWSPLPSELRSSHTIIAVHVHMSRQPGGFQSRLPGYALTCRPDGALSVDPLSSWRLQQLQGLRAWAIHTGPIASLHTLMTRARSMVPESGPAKWQRTHNSQCVLAACASHVPPCQQVAATAVLHHSIPPSIACKHSPNLYRITFGKPCEVISSRPHPRPQTTTALLASSLPVAALSTGPPAGARPGVAHLARGHGASVTSRINSVLMILMILMIRAK